MIVASGESIENPQFIEFYKLLDPKYDVPGRTRLIRQLKNNNEDSKSQIMEEQRVFMKLSEKLLVKLNNN